MSLDCLLYIDGIHAFVLLSVMLLRAALHQAGLDTFSQQ